MGCPAYSILLSSLAVMDGCTTDRVKDSAVSRFQAEYKSVTCPSGMEGGAISEGGGCPEGVPNTANSPHLADAIFRAIITLLFAQSSGNIYRNN